MSYPESYDEYDSVDSEVDDEYEDEYEKYRDLDEYYTDLYGLDDLHM